MGDVLPGEMSPELSATMMSLCDMVVRAVEKDFKLKEHKRQSAMLSETRSRLIRSMNLMRYVKREEEGEV